MGNIVHLNSHFHLPLFAWAECQRRLPPPIMMAGYRVDRCCNVQPIWREVRNMAKLTVTARILPDGSTFTAKGRDAWALLELVKAGQRGCTPIDCPGPRWSGYVFNLKRQHGLAIETRA